MTADVLKPGRWAFLLMVFLRAVTPTEAAPAERCEKLTIHVRTQLLHVYGARGGTPFIVSSGDGGWFHLGPHVAELLAARGYFVVGVDAKAYLEGLTAAPALRAEEVPGDYKALVEFAATGASIKPILVGVSEGAGL